MQLICRSDLRYNEELPLVAADRSPGRGGHLQTWRGCRTSGRGLRLLHRPLELCRQTIGNCNRRPRFLRLLCHLLNC